MKKLLYVTGSRAEYGIMRRLLKKLDTDKEISLDIVVTGMHLAKEYGKKITIIFRNYPINGHQNALSASAAVEAAGLQGKYWEMHSILYEHQSDWSTASPTERTELYKKYAQKAGVANIDKLISDMQSSNISKKINFDKALGAKDKITGTPSFFLNGKELDSSVWGDDQALRKKIDEALN